SPSFHTSFAIWFSIPRRHCRYSGATTINIASEAPDTFDMLIFSNMLILLSPAGGDASSLGNCPKLFISSGDERMIDYVE
ncbi:MAG: hypothetical protein IMX04_09500, partial [Candidatus Carbobacillus altaicus]|nr:hypothetical protein [Candidatus Carbobacillus altaicus]